MTAPKYARRPIPALCWEQRPGDTLRCTEPVRHRGDHRHAYTRTSWPRSDGQRDRSAREGVSHGV